MWSAPSTVAIGKGTRSARQSQRFDQSVGSFPRTGVGSGLMDFPLLRRLRFRRGFALLRFARAGLLGDSCDQPEVVRAPRVDDYDAFARDDIFTDVLAVITAAHFDDHDHLPKLAIDFHVAKPDNVIGEKRNRVVTELKR